MWAILKYGELPLMERDSTGTVNDFIPKINKTRTASSVSNSRKPFFIFFGSPPLLFSFPTYPRFLLPKRNPNSVSPSYGLLSPSRSLHVSLCFIDPSRRGASTLRRRCIGNSSYVLRPRRLSLYSSRYSWSFLIPASCLSSYSWLSSEKVCMHCL